ncbi:MAG: agmatinase [bacterium]|nr:agmatinase [bacterium]
MDSNYFTHPENFGEINSQYKMAKVVILPIPYDSTTSYKSGTREGPSSIISASKNLEDFDLELEKDICEIGIYTFPKVTPVLSNPLSMIKRVYKISQRIIQDGKIIVVLGGEHSLSLGVAKALKEEWDNLSVLQFDAHCDLRNSYLGTKYNHACVGRRILELCEVIQVGVRSISREEFLFIKENKRPLIIYMHEMIEKDDWIERIFSNLEDIVYITIDLDVLDPGIMPSVGTPEPGGVSWHGLLRVLKKVSERKRVVGFDVMELCPREGNSSSSYLAAKLVYKLIGYIT